MSTNIRKSNSDLWSSVDIERCSSDVQPSSDESLGLRPTFNSSASSSPQTSPKLTHRSRGSRGGSSPGASLFGASTIAEELTLLKSLDVTDSSISLDHDDAISRSSESNKSIDVSLLRALDSSSYRELLKDKKVSDKKRKSSSWYNVLNPTYKSRTEDFKRLFKDLPDAERLIVDYSCALQKDILVHGRLYISQNFICFYANIFRWETCLTIRCKDITSMTKEKTALVIPNAIQICAANERHFFTSFGARDKTYVMLFRVWQNALLEQPMTAPELWQWIHQSYGDDLGLTSDDDDYVSPPSIVLDEELKGNNGEMIMSDLLRKSACSFADSPTDLHDHSPFLMGSSLLSSASLISTLNGEHADMDVDGELYEDVDGDDEEDDDRLPVPLPRHSGAGSHSDANNHKSGGGGGGEGGVGGDGHTPPQDGSPKTTPSTPQEPQIPLHNGVGDSSESEVDGLAVSEVSCACESHEGLREMVNRVLPLSTEQALEMLFSDSKFFQDFHKERKTTDVVHSIWHNHPNGKIRQVTYTLVINLGVGLKTAQTTETQSMHKCSKPGQMYLIEVDAITTGIPYGDTFYTHHRHCITRISADSCRVRVHSQIKYKKSVWGLVKSFIEKNTWNGLDEFWRNFDLQLAKESNKIMEPPQEVAKPGNHRKPGAHRRASKLPKSVDSLEPPHHGIAAGTAPWRIPPPAAHPDVPRTTTTSDFLVPIILIVLILLLILNALLYYKLWALEAHSSQSVFPNYVVDPELLRKPKSNEDWIQLILQQESLHQTEVTKWRDVIDTVVSLLQETEHSLVSLKNTIQPYSFPVKSCPPSTPTET